MKVVFEGSMCGIISQMEEFLDRVDVIEGCSNAAKDAPVEAVTEKADMAPEPVSSPAPKVPTSKPVTAEKAPVTPPVKAPSQEKPMPIATLQEKAVELVQAGKVTPAAMADMLKNDFQVRALTELSPEQVAEAHAKLLALGGEA